MPDTPSKSRLNSQLVALGLDQAATADARHVADEKAFMAGVEPLPLSLPAERPSQGFKPWMTGWRAGVPILLAASLALLIFKPWQADDGWRVKGAGHVEIYADVGGNVVKLEPHSSLPTGAKVRVQVTAAVDTIAFSGVINGRRELLSEVNGMWNDRLALKAGEKGFFAGSIELVGVAEGETMLVVTCPAAKVEASSNAVFEAVLKDIMQHQAVGMSGCDIYSQKLR